MATAAATDLKGLTDDEYVEALYLLETEPVDADLVERCQNLMRRDDHLPVRDAMQQIGLDEKFIDAVLFGTLPDVYRWSDDPIAAKAVKAAQVDAKTLRIATSTEHNRLKGFLGTSNEITAVAETLATAPAK